IYFHTVILSVLHPPASSRLFPYTTLFRSPGRYEKGKGEQEVTNCYVIGVDPGPTPGVVRIDTEHRKVATVYVVQCNANAIYHARSEEHTSELQSRENIVCRLQLEKKKRT